MLLADTLAIARPDLRGRLDQAQKFRFSPEAIRLIRAKLFSGPEWTEYVIEPFERCWFEYPKWGPLPVGILMEPGRTAVFFGTEEWVDFDSSFPENEDARARIPAEKRQAIGTVINTLLILNTRNLIARGETDQTAHNVKRARRGRQPLYSHWTCDIRGEHRAAAAHGDVVGLVRAHLVRAHRNRRGAQAWTVAPYCRGNAALGIVTKDYAI